MRASARSCISSAGISPSTYRTRHDFGARHRRNRRRSRRHTRRPCRPASCRCRARHTAWLRLRAGRMGDRTIRAWEDRGARLAQRYRGEADQAVANIPGSARLIVMCRTRLQMLDSVKAGIVIKHCALPPRRGRSDPHGGRRTGDQEGLGTGGLPTLCRRPCRSDAGLVVVDREPEAFDP